MTRPDRRRAVSPVRRVSMVADGRAAVVARLQRSNLFREYQQAFEATTGLPLVLRAAGSFRTPLEGSKRINPFCVLMTQTNETCAACLQLQQRVETEAAQAPKTLRCYAGLSETAVPVRVGSKVLGYLQTGQVFLRPPSPRQFQDLARELLRRRPGADLQQVESAYFQTRVLTGRQYGSIVRLLAIFSEHLATVSNQMLLEEAAAEPPVIARGRMFIAEHHGEDLSLRDVAQALHISAFYFCKVFKDGTGFTFTEYLARVRIEAVKRLLLNAHTRVGEAGYAAGFQSLSQFNRVFQRVAGEAPSSYRERLRGLSGKTARPAVPFPPPDPGSPDGGPDSFVQTGG